MTARPVYGRSLFESRENQHETVRNSQTPHLSHFVRSWFHNRSNFFCKSRTSRICSSKRWRNIILFFQSLLIVTIIAADEISLVKWSKNNCLFHWKSTVIRRGVWVLTVGGFSSKTVHKIRREGKPWWPVIYKYTFTNVDPVEKVRFETGSRRSGNELRLCIIVVKGEYPRHN